jgi:N-acetylglutamate synthase-like GNAT family acetyltransferase
MNTQVIFRNATAKDIPTIEKLLASWWDVDITTWPRIKAILEDPNNTQGRCTILESDSKIVCACAWIKESPKQVKVLALGCESLWQNGEFTSRLIQEEILDWTDMRITKARICVPETFSPELVRILAKYGFIFDGIEPSVSSFSNPMTWMSKHFIYKVIPRRELMDFLRSVMTSIGYEVQDEDDGFRYRVSEELRRPFMFNPWHSVSTSGPDVLVHPPARKIRRHELENMFFPLKIYSPAEKPILLSMDRDKAVDVIDFPSLGPRQDSLFQTESELGMRELRLNNLTYCHPSGIKTIRKGLPVVFYVNKIGAVGSARIQDWHLDEPEKLYERVIDLAEHDPQDVREFTAKSGPKSGKVLVIRFDYYRPLSRPVTLNQIRGIDATFNPQRTRALSLKLFQGIISRGNSPD